MTEDLTAETQEYLNDWTLNIPKKSALHKSGVEFKYLASGEEGKPRVRYADVQKFFKSEAELGKTLDESYDDLKVLKQQFVHIYQEIISPQSNEQLPIRRIRENER